MLMLILLLGSWTPAQWTCLFLVYLLLLFILLFVVGDQCLHIFYFFTGSWEVTHGWPPVQVWLPDLRQGFCHGLWAEESHPCPHRGETLPLPWGGLWQGLQNLRWLAETCPYAHRYNWDLEWSVFFNVCVVEMHSVAGRYNCVLCTLLRERVCTCKGVIDFWWSF